MHYADTITPTTMTSGDGTMYGWFSVLSIKWNINDGRGTAYKNKPSCVETLRDMNDTSNGEKYSNEKKTITLGPTQMEQ